MIDEFFTKQDLKSLGLKMESSSSINKDISVGEQFLKPEVINQWDFNDYSDFYTYFSDKGIKFVVKICKKFNSGHRATPLKKDFSNIDSNEQND